ncbi:unnamed protein product [Mortierella alpina]
MATSTLTFTPCSTVLYTSSPLQTQPSKSSFHNAPAAPSSKIQHPNRHSFPNSNALWQQHHQQMETFHPVQLLEKNSTQKHHQPCSPPGRAGGPRLSLDTSQERLQNVTVIQHGDRSYLKLFSPALVESPVSFLDTKQLFEDKKLWENGPDEALQKKLDFERREAYKVRSKQQLRGFMLGLWLGCLMGLLIVQQTAAKVFIPAHLARRDTSPLMVLVVFLTCAAVLRSGTRCMMTAIATCAAVLTCFATLMMNQSRYASEFRLYRSIQSSSFASSDPTAS